MNEKQKIETTTNENNNLNLKQLKQIARDMHFAIENKSRKKIIAMYVDDLNVFISKINNITMN